MKPAPFDYCRPDSVEEALMVLAEYGDEAQVIAGGQSLMAMMNLRVVTPTVLLDIAGIPELENCEVKDGRLEIGAAVTQADVLARQTLVREVPLLAMAMPWIGHYQTRNRGTVCGSLSHADPSAELPVCLAALDGEVLLRSAQGERTVPAADFQTGMLSTARRPEELVVAARYPVQGKGESATFGEVARRHGDFAIVALAAVSRGKTLTLTVGGVADRPVVQVCPNDAAELDDALNDLAWALDAEDDLHATARHRRDIVRKLGRGLLTEMVT